MLTTFGGHSTSYLNDIVIEEKLKTLYLHPFTQTYHRVAISYRFNDAVSTTIENQLLRSPQYATWEDKEKTLTPMFSKKLDES